MPQAEEVAALQGAVRHREGLLAEARAAEAAARAAESGAKAQQVRVFITIHQ